MPYGNDVPQTYIDHYDDVDIDDVPLNQSIRFGATRGDYDQMNHTMNASMHQKRQPNNQEFVQQYRTN
jgi:hypothetical protein